MQARSSRKAYGAGRMIAYQMGWAAKKNGEILKLVANEFGVFLTVNQSLKHQQNLALSSLKFIILVAANNQYDSLAPLVPQGKVALKKNWQSGT
jgi:uncharacterized membrane protein (Fun14 family)